VQKVTIDKQPVFFLHVRKYTESSAILDCFSQQYGRFSILGKGLLSSHKKKTSLRPRLFQAYQVSAILRNELGVLTAIEANHLWQQPVGFAWFVANYINEMLIKLLPKFESVPELYEHYVMTLNKLSQAEDYALQLVLFEKTLLESLGYGIDMVHEARNQALIKHELQYEFNPQSGFLECDSDVPHNISGRTIIAFARQDDEYLASNVIELEAIKRIIRISLKYQLGDVNLKTIQVMREVDQYKEIFYDK